MLELPHRLVFAGSFIYKLHELRRRSIFGLGWRRIFVDLSQLPHGVFATFAGRLSLYRLPWWTLLVDCSSNNMHHVLGGFVSQDDRKQRQLVVCFVPCKQLCPNVPQCCVRALCCRSILPGWGYDLH